MKKTMIMFLVFLLVFTDFSTIGLAKCPARLEIYDSTNGNPLEGTDSATTYVVGEKCNNGINNRMRAKVTLTNSNGSVATTESALYDNKSGRISARANANNQSAKSATGYCINRCYICFTGSATMTSFGTLFYKN